VVTAHRADDVVDLGQRQRYGGQDRRPVGGAHGATQLRRDRRPSVVTVAAMQVSAAQTARNAGYDQWTDQAGAVAHSHC
jgi:hypothetical protein